MVGMVEVVVALMRAMGVENVEMVIAARWDVVAVTVTMVVVAIVRR